VSRSLLIAGCKNQASGHIDEGHRICGTLRRTRSCCERFRSQRAESPGAAVGSRAGRRVTDLDDHETTAELMRETTWCVGRQTMADGLQ